MIRVTPKQSSLRFKSLPEALQDSLFSAQTVETISRIAEQNHVPAEKIHHVADVAGFVLLGFIHPEEAAKEMQERSGLDPGTAQAVSTSLNARIFSPLQKEIDLAYAPLPEEHYEPKSVPLSRPSRVVEEIKQLKETGSELVDVLRKREERASVFPSGLKRPVDAPRTTTAPRVPSAPKSPMSIDFEKPVAPTGPKFDFTQPAPASTSRAEFPGEVPEKAGDQGPVMIHKESRATPGTPMKSFHLEMPEDKMRERGSGMDSERQPAKLDIGGMRKIPEGPAKTEVIAPKVVHYGLRPEGGGGAFGAPPSFLKPAQNVFKPGPTNFPPAPASRPSFESNFPKKPIMKEEARVRDGLPIAEPKSEKPGWLNKVLRRSKGGERDMLESADLKMPPAPKLPVVKQVDYSLDPTTKPKSEEPMPVKKLDAIKKPENIGSPPPNLPISPRPAPGVGEEIIDLNALKKLQK